MGSQSPTVLVVMGGSCAKLAMKDRQNEKLSHHDLMMDNFNEIEKSIEKELAMIKEKLRSQENEIQRRKDKLEKMEIEVRRKRPEITEKLLVADSKLVNLQREILEKKARKKDALRTREERIGYIERAIVRAGDRCEPSNKSQMTGLNYVGEEKDDGEY